MKNLTNLLVNNDFTFAIPRINDKKPGKIIFIMGFDGTNNDREQVPPNETKTVVAQLIDRVEGNRVGKPVEYPDSPVLKGYLPGPGCADSWWCLLDQATGRSSSATADVALSQLRQFIAAHPSVTEVRVVAIGFSRGAATARHFLNLVYQASADGTLGTAAPVWSSAILIETVATGQTNKLVLGFPPNLDFALHLVAKNEARTLFPPIIDDDSEYEDFARARSACFVRRIYTVKLAGAHSDLGDSYNAGAGPEVTKAAVNIIEKMGLREPCNTNACLDAQIITRNANDGLHDARGHLDHMLGASSPYSKGFKRVFVEPKKISPITEAEAGKLYTHIEVKVNKYDADIRTGSRVIQRDNFVFVRAAGQSEWEQRPAAIMGKVAQVEGALTVVFPAPYSVNLPLPEVVRKAVESEQGEVVLETGVFREERFWFVNGYIPAD